ncbi:MAG: hypothetical protein KAK00_05690 [Nanoarchaeota archaeon]|nr:hypothetical protein [Nanoarchaeota archaeon]
MGIVDVDEHSRNGFWVKLYEPVDDLDAILQMAAVYKVATGDDSVNVGPSSPLVKKENSYSIFDSTYKKDLFVLDLPEDEEKNVSALDEKIKIYLVRQINASDTNRIRLHSYIEKIRDGLVEEPDSKSIPFESL